MNIQIISAIPALRLFKAIKIPAALYSIKAMSILIPSNPRRPFTIPHGITIIPTAKSTTAAQISLNLIKAPTSGSY
jgi:hypothetical protein